jgi:membrane-bound lytic murein transglycosylase C
LLVSCSSSNKKGAETQAWVKDTNGFDILMGQFAHNIENIWGYNEVLLAGPRTTSSTDQYQTRSHINFDEGTITVETIAGTDLADDCARRSSKPC